MTESRMLRSFAHARQPGASRRSSRCRRTAVRTRRGDSAPSAAASFESRHEIVLDVHAAVSVAGAASSRFVGFLERHLQRRQLRFLARAAARASGRSKSTPRPGRLPAWGHGRQKLRRRAGVIAAVHPIVVEAREDDHLVAELLDRLQRGRELEPATRRLRRPPLHVDAVGQVDDAEPARRVARRAGEGVKAGTMASNSGNARVAPTPRITVRRDSAFLVTIMTLTSAFETACFSRFRG